MRRARQRGPCGGVWPRRHAPPPYMYTDSCLYLPSALQLRVLYLDQWALSNLAKARLPGHGSASLPVMPRSGGRRVVSGAGADGASREGGPSLHVRRRVSIEPSPPLTRAYGPPFVGFMSI